MGAGKMAGYLAAVREMDGYGGVVFPHCGADARKDGHVVPVVTFDAFRLHACREGGELEDQVIEFAWDTITTFEIDEESMTFVFQYRCPFVDCSCPLNLSFQTGGQAG